MGPLLGEYHSMCSGNVTGLSEILVADAELCPTTKDSDSRGLAIRKATIFSRLCIEGCTPTAAEPGTQCP